MRRICFSEAVGGEPGGAEHAESAGVGDRGDELRSGDAALSAADGGAHAGQRDRVLDVEQVAHFGVQDGSIHGSHPRASGVLVCVSAGSIVSLAGRRVNSGGDPLGRRQLSASQGSWERIGSIAALAIRPSQRSGARSR